MQWHLLEEVMERGESLVLARRDDALDHVAADVADGTQPEADVVADGGEVFDLSLIHI